MDPSAVQGVARLVGDNVERVIVGKRHEVLLVLVALLCRGHVLIEDVPGVGKTVLAKAVARSIGCTFKRIQFTPDLLPSDVTGVNVFNQQTSRFEYRPGPVVAQLVLADEINRATANPIEYEGTFPLPEAQLDRFLIRMSMGYPGRAGELEMLERQHRSHPLDDLQQSARLEDLVRAQAAIKEVHVAAPVREYIVNLVEVTRKHDDVYLGASPRGSLALYNATRAWAALHGRDFVTPDDVKMLAEATLAHRIIVNPAARIKNVDSRVVIADVLSMVPVPGAQPVAPAGRGWGTRQSGL